LGAPRTMKYFNPIDGLAFVLVNTFRLELADNARSVRVAGLSLHAR
jgi:hypothetical protein